MFAPAGLELIFSKVAIKPGKPVWLGRAGGALVIGLPGNPNSALVTARLLLAPLLAGLTGRAPALAWRQAPLAEPLPADRRPRDLLSRRCGRRGACAAPSNQDSRRAEARSPTADLLIRRAAGAPAAEAGEVVGRHRLLSSASGPRQIGLVVDVEEGIERLRAHSTAA